MTEHTTGPHPLKPADRGALWFLIVIGAAVAITSIAFNVMRIFEVLLGEAIRVTADLSNYAPTFLNETDQGLPITIDSATFTVPHLPDDALIAAIVQPSLLILMTLGISVAFAVLARNVVRGRVFSYANTVALATGWGFAVVGFVPQPALQWRVATGALEEFGFEATQMLALHFQPFPFIALVIMLAITMHAFSTGTKLQRETEGLV